MIVAKRVFEKGFTLIEMMLIMVVISIFIIVGFNYSEQRTQRTHIDLTVMQMQQILNAAMVYYLNNGVWPGNAGDNEHINSPIYCLQGQQKDGSGLTMNDQICNSTHTPYLTYLSTPPASGMVNNQAVFSYYYGYWNSSTPDQFIVELNLQLGAQTQAIANAIAMRLPHGIAVIENTYPISQATTNLCIGTSMTSCWVIGMVDTPGQNLNNATSVNFANLYHHGACVPVPSCPYSSITDYITTPQIFVVPTSVGGYNDSTNQNVYPLSAFTAYAVGPGTSNNGQAPPCPNDKMTSPQCLPTNGGAPYTTGNYWRVCLQVQTEAGALNGSSANTQWADNVSVLAFTRCSVKNENVGSDFSVFSN